MLNPKSLEDWRRDNGDATHIFDHSLTENSVVMDVGAYTGVWAEQVVAKFNPRIILLEPVHQFFAVLENKFSDNPKVDCYHIGLSDEEQVTCIDVRGDASSVSKDGEAVTLTTLSTVMEQLDLKWIDLLQINIEGSEYPVVNEIIDSGTIDKIGTIQIQFHQVGFFEAMRTHIHQNLEERGFTKKYDYPFVWEAWTNGKV